MYFLPPGRRTVRAPKWPYLAHFVTDFGDKAQAESYAQAATAHRPLLMAFVVDTHGAFKCRDDDFDPAVGPPHGIKHMYAATKPATVN